MFCGKCGAKIETNTKFCPQCGAPLKADNRQPEHKPTPKIEQNSNAKMTPAVRASYAISLLLALVIAWLWGSESIAVSGMASQDTYVLAEIVGETINLGNLAVVLLAVFSFIGCLFGDGLAYLLHKLNTSTREEMESKRTSRLFMLVMPGVCLIWDVVIFGFGMARVNDTASKYNGLLKVGPTAMGWLYIMCCVVLAGLVVFQLAAYAKARKEAVAR